MSLKSTIEILVNLQQFRNIDLFHQGVYQLRVTIFQKNGGNVRSAQPYMVVEDKKDVRKPIVFANTLPKNASDCIIQGSRLQDVEFWSKAFVVKYCDESVELNDGCVFRIEVDAFPKFDQSDIFMVVELMFTELATLTQEDFKQDKLKTYMKAVAKFESRLNNVFTGIKEFVPISFDEMHFCVVKGSVHSMLFDFRFRQIPSANEDALESFDQFLRRITNQYEKAVVEDFYSVYVKTLKQAYEHFLKYHQYVLQEFLHDPQLIEKFLNQQITPHFPPFLKRKNFGEEEEAKDNRKELQITNYFDLKQQSEQTELANTIMLEINQLSSLLFQVWYQFLEAFEFVKKDLGRKLESNYLGQIKERWGESIFQDTRMVEDLAQYFEPKIGRRHKEQAQQMRSKQYYQSLEPLNVEDLNLFPKAKIHPIVFREVYIKADQVNKLKSLRGIHLIVLAHGYQGNSYDMRIWKNILAIKYPDHLYLSMTCNEDNTEQDIIYMGQRLADEVKRWIKDWCPKDNFSKLSFIGHSLGGLIIRAALPHLEKYKDKMHSIITLGTPHLGYILPTSKVVDTGLWLIKKWKKCTCLNQLSMTDSSNYEDCAVYRLSTFQGLGWFRNIVLVSSYQDTYVPFESARISRSSKVTLETEKGRIYNKMIDNLMNQLQTDKIVRLDVNYEIPGKNLDNMIGRAAHIQFLECQPLIKLIVYSFDDLFD